ncbi:F-box/kelch-repeat protein SKIP25 [Tanacetum coccineum]
MENHHPQLLPGLPDHIALLCLNLVPPSKLYSVCRLWRRLIYTRDFPSFLSIYTLSSDQNSTLQLSSFDPISSTWSVVTPTPPDLQRVEAIDAVGVNGKLYMVNGKEGAVYDVNMDTWTDMPAEMLAGWRVWVDVLEDERLIKAEYIAAAGGRVCVVRDGGGGILVVDVSVSMPRVWIVDTPAGNQVLRVHILPRMCLAQFESEL